MDRNTINNGLISKSCRIQDVVFIIILAIYPLRHIACGIDLWDTGYNYANFEYMGLEHMDSMWLFSTYLANAVGYLITKLPFALSLLGMNLYTGLFVSVLAVSGYFFCTRKLGIVRYIVFAGELIAISLCWCPTALLYNYLTYVLLLVCVILLYCGLTENKNLFLFIAGLCLGANVLVRFSNLPEAALIVAVWAYGIIEWLDAKRAADGLLRKTVYRTLICLGGELTALSVLLLYIHIRYGIGQYAEGIRRLFALTDNATDYRADSMLFSMLTDYTENLYWVVRILAIIAVGMLVFFIAGLFKGRKRRLFVNAARTVSVILAALMVAWLYYRGFCSVQFFTYGPIRRPAIVFLMLSMAVGMVRIFDMRAPKEEKLISGLVILVILITSIGSNNKTYPSINNLFVAAPYTLWEIYKFIKNVRDRRPGGLLISLCPAKCIITAFLLMFAVQCAGFGMVFVFAEATGAQDMTAEVTNNDILAGIKMNPERAVWMTELSEYVDENSLTGEEVILFGQLPALSFYLQMPSAFNPWSDLTSYSAETFGKELGETADRVESDSAYQPVIILENKYAECLEGLLDKSENLQEVNSDDILQSILGENAQSASVQEKTAAEKFVMLLKFVDNYGYDIGFRNDKFAVLTITSGRDA